MSGWMRKTTKWMRTRSQSVSARGFSPKRKRYVFLRCGCVSVIQTSNPRESCVKAGFLATFHQYSVTAQLLSLLLKGSNLIVVTSDLCWNWLFCRGINLKLVFKSVLYVSLEMEIIWLRLGVMLVWIWMFLLLVCPIACCFAVWIVHLTLLRSQLASVCMLPILSKPFLTLCLFLMSFRVPVRVG